MKRHQNSLKKIIVVLGPTASGKSELAIKLAKKFNGEIVSADSRQIYKKMNIGTAKPPQDKKLKVKNGNYLVGGIPHHLIDVIGPNGQFSAVKYRDLALKAIKKIYTKGKIPIVCGGTGFYIRALIDNIVIPAVKPDKSLRKILEKKTSPELLLELKRLDPQRAKNIDPNNRRRLIRAIEIIKKTNKPIPRLKSKKFFNPLYIGIKKSPEELKNLIDARVKKMIKNGLEKEVKNLVKKYGWTTVLKNTIGYKEWLEKKPESQIKANTLKFAKRQITWFKKYPGEKIHWVTNLKQAEKLIKEFLQSK